jgi:hypothetical protein
MPIEWIFIQITVNTIEVGVLFYLLCSKFTAKYRTFIPTVLFNIGMITLISLPIFFSLEGILIAEIVVLIGPLMYLLFFRNGSILKKIFWTLISLALLIAINFCSVTSDMIARIPTTLSSWIKGVLIIRLAQKAFGY